jgi:hypothetical protein
VAIIALDSGEPLTGIRKALLDARLIDAVISLPLNVFYGAGVPACLLILRKQRVPERRDQVLLIYAARHYRELSAQNELRPQDVMRMLVHCHAYGDSAKVSGLVAEHSARIRKQIDLREEDVRAVLRLIIRSNFVGCGICPLLNFVDQQYVATNKLRGSNSEPYMSARGQFRPMSAACPLLPRKRPLPGIGPSV